jgi:hypothetical protein
MVTLTDFLYTNRYPLLIAVCSVGILILTIVRFRKIGVSGVKKEITDEISSLTTLPEHDLDTVIDLIKKTTYPASLGTLNLIFYNFTKEQNSVFFYSPESAFLYSALLFFITAILVGMTYDPPHIQPDPKQKKGQALSILSLFLLAIVLDLLGVFFLVFILIAG